MAMRKCVAREMGGTTDTLGPAIRRLNLPALLDRAVEKLWGFTSQQGCHIFERRQPQFEEAELVVTGVSALSVISCAVELGDPAL